MKIVVVSQRVDVHEARHERRDALDQRLIQWLICAGYAPIPVPNVMTDSSRAKRGFVSPLLQWLDTLQPAAFVLSGGNDIGDSPDRDATEHELLDYAHARSAPVLGICRGMQMMAVWGGGKLKSVAGHVGTRHVLKGMNSDEVNSYHSYALESCPPGYSVLATAIDGCIESIRHQHLPWEGWMWHPERESEFTPLDLLRLKELFGC